MSKRPIDRSKKSNIKCKHCLYCDEPMEYFEKYHCCLHAKEVNYWNRCKDFKWSKKGSDCYEKADR